MEKAVDQEEPLAPYVNSDVEKTWIMLTLRSSPQPAVGKPSYLIATVVKKTPPEDGDPIFTLRLQLLGTACGTLNCRASTIRWPKPDCNTASGKAVASARIFE
jgi:hypothetical protein